MIGNFFIKIFSNVLFFIDLKNKNKVKKFFLDRLKTKQLTIIDIGAHKGETIEFFLKNFNLKKIFSFEPNREIFLYLKNKYKNNYKIHIQSVGVGKFNDKKKLNIFTDTSSSTIHQLNKNTDYYRRKKKILSYFSNKNFLSKIQDIEIRNLSELIKENNIIDIDILKIDTEGYEYNIISGIRINDLKKINFIYFEHHYDLMIKKNYKFSDIHNLLHQNGFKKKLKIKMNFRKTFEYIYEKI